MSKRRGADCHYNKMAAGDTNKPGSRNLEQTPTDQADSAHPLSWSSALCLALLSGFLLAIAFPKFDWFPCSFIGMIPLLCIAERATPGCAFIAGWLAGVVKNFICYGFLTVTLDQFGGYSYGAAVLGTALVALYQGFRFGFFVWLLGLARRNKWPSWLAGPAVLVALEFLMPYLFVSHLGNSIYLFPAYIQIADLVGVYGVSAAVLLFNILLYEFWMTVLEKRRVVNLKLLGSLLVFQGFVFGYGTWRVSNTDSIANSAPSRNLGVIQPGFDSTLNSSLDDHDQRISVLVGLSRDVSAQGADLIVWPETSYRQFIWRRSGAIAQLLEIHDGFSVPLIFGATTRDADAEEFGGPARFNSAIMITSDNVVRGIYDKNFLVWFTECIPFSETLPFLEEWYPNASRFQRGTKVTLFPFQEFQIAPGVCNDDIMPAFTMRLRGLPANLMVNIANDDWFGDTAEPHSHLALSTFRAVENHLCLVRVTNSGISSRIDPSGRIELQTDITLDTDETIAEVWPVKMMPATETVYRRIGNSFAYLCIFITALTVVPPFAPRQHTWRFTP